MITYEYDNRTLRDVERKLGSLKSEAPKALKDAINATARQARTDLAAEAQKTYTVKNAGFNRQMKLFNATKSHLEALISSRGENLPMKSFSVRVLKHKISVEINRKNSRKALYGKYFVNNIARRGQVRKKATNKGAKGTAVKHLAVAKRESEKRLHIHEIFSVSIPQMIGNEKDVYGIVEPNIESNLQSNVNRQVAKILGR